MSRSIFLLAASSLALAACQPAEEAAGAFEAERPPVVEQPAQPAETSVSEAPEATEPVAATDDQVEEINQDEAEPEAEDHDHAADEHDDHAEHGEDEHDDHDHGDAGGEAHVHGLSDLAASLEGATLSVSIEGALANFDLDESLRALDDTSPYTDGVVEIVGGECSRDSADAAIRAVGDHGNLVIDLTYTCSAPGGLEGIEVTGFQSFTGFEEVNAVYLTDADQVAESLTEGNTRLDIN